MSTGVITAVPPCSATAARIRSSSVATITSSTNLAWEARSMTWTIIGFPAMSASGLPTRRCDPKRAGMIATVRLVRAELIGHQSPLAP
jgi:hypothetical protein